ncbi:peptidoglycan recognition family protein [Kribbella catacumbae]|uniref:peptidoglycan recognition protein family protein n=1 Tax=Kribbella catacumbae TaxID=460086 RepID=UPI000362A293|nr:peptidoglycan recognition family protein [Kribbella catacumbae]
MVDYLPRTAWGARVAEDGPGSLTVARVEGVAVHWPGMGRRRLGSLSEVASALRGWQNYHMDPKPNGRGWSDIAYQVAVDQAGRAWTLRGLRTQSGANGNTDVNQRFGAVLLVVGSGEHPSPAMIATTREVIRDFQAIYPNCDLIAPHSKVRPDGTDCPGDLVRALIKSGAFTPGTAQEDDMQYTETQIRAMVQAELEEYHRRLWGEGGTAGEFMQRTDAALVRIEESVTPRQPS